MNKIIIISLVTFLVVFGVIFVILPPTISDREIRIYIWLFIVTQIVATFANLRLYNAIVINSSINNKLRAALLSVTKKFDALGNQITNLKTKVGGLTIQITNWLNENKNKRKDG